MFAPCLKAAPHSAPRDRSARLRYIARVTRLTATARLLARDAFLVLATLAIALKIIIPVGFMPGADQRNGLPFALVLCTADGAKTVAAGDVLGSNKGSDKGGKPAHDAPCPFAAQGANAPPPSLIASGAAQIVAYVEPIAPSVRAIMPGRGLAAPPPPPTGPPTII